jgi:hypothetical protein
MATEVAVANGLQVAKANPELNYETLCALVLNGDLSRLTPGQKVEYYRAFCARVGLDPATQPFKLLKLQGKETLYCDRGGTAQLNKKHEVSHKIVERRKEDDICIVTAQASTKDGRCTESIGAVPVSGLKGEALANAMMKAETKAKRRSTLDLLGLGMLDESEVDSIHGAIPAGAPSDSEPLKSEPANQPESAGAPDPEIEKGWRKWRGTLNQRLLKCKTPEEVEAVKDAFEAKMGRGAGFWRYQRTYHNDFETFGTLLDEHRARVNKDAEMAGPEGIKVWIAGVMATPSVRGLEGFVKSYRDNERYQVPECEAALHERAMQLGLQSYTDCDADDLPFNGEDEGSREERGIKG